MVCEGSQFSYNTYTAERFDGEHWSLIYAGHYRCCAENRCKEDNKELPGFYEYCLKTWQGGQVVEKKRVKVD